MVDGDVGVLAHLNVPLRAENEEPSIAPGSQPIRSEPVQPDIAEALVAAQHHVAEVLEARMLRMRDVRDLRLYNFGLRRSCVVEKLVYLMRADIAQDAAIL